MNGFEHFARQHPDAPYLKGRFHSNFPRGQTALIDIILKLLKLKRATHRLYLLKYPRWLSWL
jgi:hypothetical protein